MSETVSEKKQNISTQQSTDPVIDPVADPESSNEELEQETTIRKVVAKVIESEFSGPIPPPNIMRGYEEILPGAADRILSMAERQSQHRQDMEKKIVEAEARDSYHGVWFAFIMGMTSLACGTAVALLIREGSGVIMGSIFGAAGLGTIITAFIKGTRSNKK